MNNIKTISKFKLIFIPELNRLNEKKNSKSVRLELKENFACSSFSFCNNQLVFERNCDDK